MDKNNAVYLINRIAEYYNEKVISCIDINNMICVYITNIDKLKHKSMLSNLEGRGITYEDACIDYIINALDTQYTLRHNHTLYVTTKIRKILKSNYKSIKRYMKGVF